MSTPAEHRQKLLNGFLECTLDSEGSFLKVKETLTRIGIASRKNKTLYQSCHILHKKGKYYIVHFKELLQLDGLNSDFTIEDQERRNQIAHMLSEWGLIKIVDPEKFSKPTNFYNVRVIPYKQKEEWTLVPKYSIGKKVGDHHDHRESD